MTVNPNHERRSEQVKEILRQRFFPAIPENPMFTDTHQRELNRFSRSLAAFAVHKLADCSVNEAASAVVDCGDDNGIDAIYYERASNRLYLIQSKYGDAPGRADCLTFCSGVKDLLLERYERFYQSGRNPEFDRVQSDVEDALQSVHTSVVAGVVYMGNALGNHAISDLDQLREEQNATKNWFEWRNIGLSCLHGWLSEEQRLVPVSVDLAIEQWNAIQSPRRAVYGLVQASQLADLYHTHGNALFGKNIRYYLGSQSINSAIISTLQDHPTELFFWNNGITAICSHYEHAGNRQARATFHLTDFSIVNGAQTVGSIGEASRAGATLGDAKLLITIIEVPDSTSDVSATITRTRNTQNTVTGDNFIALDPNQERLRQELAISGITYHYRPTAAHEPANEDHVTLDEAIRALACLSGNTQIVVTAKREIGQVIDTKEPIYPQLFRSSMSGIQLLWNVRLYRYMDGLLNDAESAEHQERRRAFYRHGRYFILHIWARRNQAVLSRPDRVLSNDLKLQLSAELLELSEKVYDIAEPMFGNSQKGYLKIFRNLTDAEPLARAVMQSLNNS